MRFDYYTASIDSKPDHVLEFLRASYDLSDLRAVSPKNGFERAYNVVRGEHTLARVQFGGAAVGPRVWASASGDDTPAFVDRIRSEFTDQHNLLRADVAMDYCEEGSWEKLYALGISTADKFGLKVKHVGDYHREEDGRTLYIGSRTSPAMQRIYEKGKQMGSDPNYVRSELEVKPQNAKAKKVYAYAPPEHMWLATKWTQHVLEMLTGMTGLQPAPLGTIRKKTDDEKALEFMAKQYGNVLRRKLEELGGDMESFGLFVANLIAK